MRHATLMLIAVSGLGLPLAIGLTAALALTVPKIDNAATAKECGACHMVYPPQLLPQRSWVALLDKLDNHFGEIASLNQQTHDDIQSYLVSNAADAQGAPADSRLLRGLKDGDAPLRITELPWWIRRHGEVNFTNIKATKVKSPSNCVGCHAGAANGVYSEE